MRLGGRKLSGGVALGLVLAVAAAGIAVGERVQAGKLVLDVGGGFKPRKLPKKRRAPITLKVRADISTTDGSVPPPLQRLVLDFDRNGLLQNKRLPTCQPSKLENTTPAGARKACKRAIVGRGSVSALIAFPDQAPIPASSPLTLFNGPKLGGKPSVIIHAYAVVPAPATFVIPSPITRAHGRYRYEVTANIPPIAGGYGSITHFGFKIHRLYKSKGKRRSYVSARCADGRLQAGGQFTFADGTAAAGSVFRPCKARR